MADIKIKKKSDIKIKKINKAEIYTQKLKSNLVDVKEKTNDISNKEDNTPTEYGADKISNTTRTISNKGINTFNKYGQKSVKQTKQNIEFAKDKIKKKIQNRTIKLKTKEIKGIVDKGNKTIKNVAQKNTKRIVKNAPKTAERTMKGTKVVAKQTARGAKGFQDGCAEVIKAEWSHDVFNGYYNSDLAKLSAFTEDSGIAKGIKVGAKATISTVKGIIAGLKALITALIAGGWIALVIIIIICMIGLICSSVFGIFFSNEKKSGNKDKTNDRTMSSVVTEINTEFANKITEIQKNNAHDDYEIKSERAEWRDIISVYAVLVTNGEEQSDVITLDDKKIQKLKDIFWEMNEVSSKVEEVEKDIETTDEKGNKKIEKSKRKVLYITVKKKSVEEMIEKYNMNNKQKEQLAEIRKEEYLSMWSNVLYGSSAGSNDIVQVAFSQIGNVGGQPYWSWYGFSSRVEWCACFVSWCANQCGYIDSGIIPKFASCEIEGVTWFKTCGLWQERGYSPKARRYNFL